MCTYQTHKIQIDGSGKARKGWIRLREATVYVDHPVHLQQDHSVNIDLFDPSQGPSARVAVELTEEAALALADAIHQAIAAAPPGLASARARTA
jgi:predicted lipase